MSIRIQLLIGFSVLILIFVSSFFINQQLSKAVLTNTSYLNNSEAIIRNSNILHKEMIKMQSGFRGFLLTNQEVFLKSYYEGINSIPPLIKEQQQLLSVEAQKKRLDSITTLHRIWSLYADSLISAKRDTVPESVLKYERLFNTNLRMEVGKKLNDKIQVIFNTFDNYEYKIRQERRTALQASVKRTRNITVLLTAISIFIALVSSIYFIRTITKRISTMVVLADEISKGNFKVIEDSDRDELNKLSVSLNSMSQTLERNFKELREKNNELDQFAYVVSHDLKAPLRGISNLIEWLEEDHGKEISPAISHNLERIKGRTNRLENMINGLLEYAKIGKTKNEVEVVNIQTMIEEIIDLIVPDGYDVQIRNLLPIIVTEKLYIEQVFSNLINNAVKHNNRKNGKITITSKELANFYEFSVIDNGPGIEAEYFDKIFVIFQTLQERDAFETTGIGLAIVKKIVEDHKGAIKVESVVGEGSTFTFSWPKN